MNEWPMEYQAYGVTLKPLSQAMLETVRQWRNDPIIADLMLDKTHITAQMQQAWFDKLQGDKSRGYWVVYFKDEAIGVASLVRIDMEIGRAEPGFYIYHPKCRRNIVPFCAAFALNDFAFERMRLSALDAVVLSSNSPALRFNETCGYQHLGERDGFVSMRLTPDHYQKARAPISRFIRY